MPTQTLTHPTRLPQGNSGREYAVHARQHSSQPVRLAPMTGRRMLPSQVADLRAADARALGVRLIELAALCDVQSAVWPAPHFAWAGGRGYGATLYPRTDARRRVRLVVIGRDSGVLGSVSDSFTVADARALGVALIAAAGQP